jgi:peptide chain release factor 3
MQFPDDASAEIQQIDSSLDSATDSTANKNDSEAAGFLSQVRQRRTFAIISHPDAGKTTLTEKLLLYAGMLRTAGMVSGRKNQKTASSDWMKMEQERGISISASAMQFGYKDTIINVLDTPGHQDFSEDTYRTLTAADSAVMVIDAGNGVEAQTRKLFAVCRMRGTPILTFINKMDLPSKDPIDLMAEVETVLGIKASAINWPIGRGSEFCGVVDRRSMEAFLFTKSDQGGAKKAETERMPFSEVIAKGLIPAEIVEQTQFELDLLEEAGNPFTEQSFLAGEVTPVFFGSALTNFGVEPFFDSFTALAPCPSARQTIAKADNSQTTKDIAAPFSAYVFKVQANMDPKHRDSMAFLRVCSGVFSRDLVVKHERSKKQLKLSRSHSMFGGERTTVDEAFPGDIVGVVNPGMFSIGDTVSVEGGFTFEPMPKFPPEVVATLTPLDALKSKAFQRGMEQFRSEGAVLILQRRGMASFSPLVAAVGPLQFEVLQYRLEQEYGAKTRLDILPYKYGAWLVGDAGSFVGSSGTLLAEDADSNVLCLYTQGWERGFLMEKNPNHQLQDFL